MDIAEREFKIPQVLEPEHFASQHLDELSGMTYHSYFMKEEDSPGYYSTLNWVKHQIPNLRINNFWVSRSRSRSRGQKPKCIYPVALRQMQHGSSL